LRKNRDLLRFRWNRTGENEWYENLTWKSNKRRLRKKLIMNKFLQRLKLKRRKQQWRRFENDSNRKSLTKSTNRCMKSKDKRKSKKKRKNERKNLIKTRQFAWSTCRKTSRILTIYFKNTKLRKSSTTIFSSKRKKCLKRDNKKN